MMLGKIVWFGGFNNQKNKVNNFGFIAPLGEENTGDIRVDRDDVPLDVQEIIEGNKGRGVYVQFDIDAKRNRVINLKVPTFIGVVKRYQFGGAWQITYNDNCKINFRSKTHYESESLVAFSIKETKDREAMEMAEIFGEDEEIKYKLAPFLLRTINDVREVDNDERIVEKYANSNIFPLFKKFIIEYLLSLPLEIAETFVINKLKDLNENQQDFIIKEIAEKLPNLLIISATLRSYLKFDSSSPNSYIEFINRQINLVEEHLRKELIDELIKKVEQAEENALNIYWQEVQYLQDNLAYKNFLWHIAPAERKIPIIAEYTSSIAKDVAEKVVLEHLNQFNQQEQDKLINELIRNAPKVILASSKLRSYLKFTEYYFKFQITDNNYGIFINKYLHIVDDELFNEIINELIERVEQAEEKERNIYWQQVQYLQDNLAYKNFIWHIAPTERKIPIIVTYTLFSTEDVAENVVLEHLNQFNQKEQDELINQLIKNAPKVILASSKLRSYLKLTEYDYNSYGILINQYLDSVDDDLFNEIVNELIERVEQAKERERNIYWQQVKYLQNNLAYKNFLWHIAPTGKKQEIVQQRVKTFFDIISRFEDSNYPYEEYITHNWRELYQFNQSDNSLIREWDADVNFNDNKAAQMISARGAEKLVIRFYQALGYQVEDISIHQVTQKSKTWTLGDIRLDSQYLLDVKNSRKSVNSNSYSEFCVPQFKESRGNDVKIVGVLSPYLQKKYMQGRENPKFHVKNPQVLGAFDKAKLSELETIFSDRFISINMPRESDTNKYLPPWLFDYDQRYYKQQCEILIELQKLSDQDIPSWEDISVVAQNSIPLFVAAKRPLPQNWVNNLPQWQVNFINFLINLPIERITLPYLFLSILRHFLSMLSYRGGDYSPKRYLEVFYLSEKQIKPLKLYDPLNIIEDFCDTLQTLWDNRQASRLDEFKIFKFSGQGLLQGKRTESERILQYYCQNKSLDNFWQKRQK
ncbi:hypothetical protein FJR06_22365 [Dolichospermum sp. UHCC 0352]|uniref:hypothetical protein n=1 Tax=Dolichospermum sp. UHCC 0352 TaxID=2590011 RepID=UPI0014482DAF|nr:hypothetical protein [Dolichospermum sp. UHCC 0352]MTJ23906.1 hypothetical protein [Dolichospermum sp. UHCC 0352]